MEKMIYKYGYRLRPPSIGTQPNGFKILSNTRFGVQLGHYTEMYWGYVTYDRKLTDEEMFEYDLDLLEVEDDERN